MRGLVAALGASLVIAAAAGCSGDGGRKPASEQGTSSSAPRPVPAAEMTAVPLPGQPGPLVDLIARQVRTAGTVHAELLIADTKGGTRAEERITGQLRTSARPPSGQLTIVDKEPSGGSTTEAVVAGGVAYVRVDGEEQAPGKPWVRLSRKDAAHPDAGPFAKLLGSMLDQIDAALGQITTDTGLGLVRNGAFKGAPATEALEGTQVRRYTGVTPATAMSGADPIYQALAKAGLKEVGWTLWVDGKGLPRKFHVEFITPQGVRTVQTAAYRRWGEAVIIAIPEPAKVHSIAS